MTARALRKKDWKGVPRRALSPTEVVNRLITAPGWKLSGDGPQVVIEKTFTFGNDLEALAFVNSVGFIAHRQDHHPELAVLFNRCTVRFNTHDVGGISETDFDCAALVDALLG